MSRPLLLLLALTMTACTFGPLRQSRVEPLAPWRQVHGLRVLTSGAGSPDLHATLSKSAGEALTATTDLALAGTDVTAFELHLQVTTAPAETPAAQSDVQDSAAATARTALGLGLGEGSQRGQLAVTATLHAPGRPQPVGLARWTAIGSPDALALDAGHDLGDRLGRGVTRQRLQWLHRRAADERLFRGGRRPAPARRHPRGGLRRLTQVTPRICCFATRRHATSSALPAASTTWCTSLLAPQ
jgi:hypothetical protein